MKTKSENTVKLLNQLLEINNDRIQGYEKAAHETEDSELMALFTGMAEKSRTFRSELISEIVNHSGTPTESTTTSGKVFRAWMDIKAALTGKGSHAIISSCEFGEDAALETYDEVLKSTDLSQDTLTMVSNQRSILQESHDRIKTLRDSVKEIK